MHRTALSAAVSLALAIALAAPAAAADTQSTTEATSAEDTAAFDPYAQTIAWADCDAEGPGSDECATVTVPIDYSDPAAGTTTIALEKQSATGSKQGTLFINPGGPGGSGVEFLPAFSFLAPGALGNAYDIIGFDPRGVGASDPLGCIDAEGLDELLAASLDAGDPAAVEQVRSLYADMAEGCLETNPQLAQHVTTVETARDLDVLRALVGEEQLDYYGASYGTYLGATYAALFPERVGRMVLDGAADPSLSQAEMRLVQGGGFQLAFEDYVADCLTADCPLGASLEEVEQKVADLLEATATEPLATDDPDRPLTQSFALYGITAPLYSQDQWPVLTEALVAAFGGDGSQLLAIADLDNQRTAEGYANNLTQVNAAINCLDTPLKPEPATTPTLDDFVAASPLFGRLVAGFAAQCDAWPIEPTVEAPDYTAAGAAPILVVGTTGDPATPYESAVKLADELESGVLLTREGEGHTAYFSGNVCISDAITGFLVDGTVPEDGTECAASA